MTGDCGGKLECAGNGAAPPTSLFEITLGHGSNDKDFYDVSLVDGYNLPIVAIPTGGGLVGACNATGCVADINISCPKELQVMGAEEQERGGGVVACMSACEAFGLDQYCCSGQFANPNTCRPSSYSTVFKRACPRAYSYAFDDRSSTFTCKASEYAIIFCPGRVKRPSSQNSDPTSPHQNPYGQPMAPPTQNPYGQPMAPPTQNQNPPGPNPNQMTPPQSQNGQFMMPPPTVNQAPNDQFINPPIEDESERDETGTLSSSNTLRPYPVLLLLGLSLTALRQSCAT